MTDRSRDWKDFSMKERHLCLCEMYAWVVCGYILQLYGYTLVYFNVMQGDVMQLNREILLCWIISISALRNLKSSQ